MISLNVIDVTKTSFNSIFNDDRINALKMGTPDLEMNAEHSKRLEIRVY